MHSWSHSKLNSEGRQRNLHRGVVGHSERLPGSAWFRRHKAALVTTYWGVTASLFIAGLLMLILYTPLESTFGPVQRVFYLHLPTAICTFVAAFTLFVASSGYLWSRSMKWDDLAHSSGKVTVLFCTVVLFSGMIWGKSEWGAWWTWSPRLTFSLILWVLYVVYLAVRIVIQSPTRRASVCAVYGLAAFIDVPLVYVSVKLIPDIHPSSIELNSAMQLTLFVWSFAIPMLMVGLIVAGYSVHLRERTCASEDIGSESSYEHEGDQ